MKYKLLGNSGLRVSELCLGTMTFGTEWGWGATQEESRKIFDSFAEAGGQFLDTANCYTDGTSERFLADFLAKDRTHFVLGTKYSMSMRRDDPNAGGNHRKNMVQSLEASLVRLKTDYIDLYWLHAWDFLTPVEEVMRALDDLVRSGKILYVGISDTPAWIVAQANTLASLRGWTPFVGLQIQYSLMERTPERDLLPMARALDLGITAWRALGAGLLTGKYNTEKPGSPAQPRRIAVDDARLTERNLSIAAALRTVAQQIGRSPAQVALNWLRQQPGVLIPILGARTLEQLRDNLGCLDFGLGQDELQALDHASRIDLGFPHDFLAADSLRKILYGDTLPLLENHRWPGKRSSNAGLAQKGRGQ
jgi:aryl-alcohol dehydrogenase-like predicted oxidoreductase